MTGEGRRPLEEVIRRMIRAELETWPRPADGYTPVKGKDFDDGRPGADCDMAQVRRHVDAFLVRFQQPKDGQDGRDGLDGWSPLLAVVSDDERRVLQVVRWIGGQGHEPESGYYIGPLGPVLRIEDGTDIRGPAGRRAESGGGGSDEGLRIIVSQLVEENAMEDFDQVPLDDQTNEGGSPAVLTFNFGGGGVHKVWVKLLATSADDASAARVRTDGSDPDSDTGHPIEAGVPQPIAVLTSQVKVYTPAGKTVSVTGYRRRT